MQDHIKQTVADLQSRIVELQNTITWLQREFSTAPLFIQPAKHSNGLHDEQEQPPRKKYERPKVERKTGRKNRARLSVDFTNFIRELPEQFDQTHVEEILRKRGMEPGPSQVRDFLGNAYRAGDLKLALRGRHGQPARYYRPEIPTGAANG